MSISAAHWDRITSPEIAGDELRKAGIFLSGAGTPTVTATVPDHLGQEYLDTSAAMFYKACALSSPPVVGNWKLISI